MPTVLQMLASVPGAADRDWAALRSIAYGASSITTTVLKQALSTFGCDLYQVYGMTETTGAIVQLAAADHDPGGPREHLLRSAGKPTRGWSSRSSTRPPGRPCPPARSARCASAGPA